jgi:hypothetical protein
MTEYRYQVLEEALVSIAKDGSDKNIVKQVNKLTSDEIRKLRTLMVLVEGTILNREYDELFGVSDD